MLVIHVNYFKEEVLHTYCNDLEIPLFNLNTNLKKRYNNISDFKNDSSIIVLYNSI